MHNKTPILALALSLSVLAGSVSAASVDIRGQYRSEQDKFESRVLLNHEWSNGIGAGFEYVVDNTSKAGEGIDQARWKENELELYYKYKVSDTLTLLPSVLFQDTKASGDIAKIGLRANWAFAPTWRLDARVRYEHKTRDTRDLAKQWDNDDTTRSELWLRKTFNKDLETYYNFRWDHKLNNYAYPDKSSNLYEHNVGAAYKLNANFKPYAEIGYLPDALIKNKALTDDWRFRLGLVYSF
ncbi:oligogalacturonate-specific porin KdgM family protein [Chitinibacter sp. ZOR0017]|uniref:oligogalacturonate-specific porin KdgM family protein n=1 Tax=Chitinibacter sp. ZOR0017 TaxID=1339254 RepID=UPI0006463F79|nr:oligogalacturonate-specific porin KdgM family protein [Chitinibacter sp. ZOR0017]